MPHIVFDGPELSKEQKKELIKNFTDTASKVTNIPKEAFVVMIKENDLENIGVGGELLSEKK
ncbi:MAG: 4-oxalocrotonate tautomerase [Halanaerobium sp. 4-GBenrich]|jgi:4-oxalocrotonate tautomerase|uniref:4-oxalocrotonate tautomerase n=1 Tax=Halanaerobium congolense TaxID=54121 RepID=A0A1G6LFS9_9FIRM|nr:MULTISPECIES: 4-oxalocrotonate tautomerase DmpI [Halanaerobium]KXS47364.1 MAG: 4-oxalocrotonate tautomerase [Halanaerobium sp. T82-1]ODS50225.1 MAG: 4-oxalocrotonate tautomerase [Halanaerobium sp. 4-GBenrich]PUU88016.1 MAG: 4-oxalocrotonate tautomerase [Halanaerobium sp.]PUU91764.1 MAG: 4-oxalocrotonate tautomerase [Halanaerobium sp.]TDP14195.1 4-oxalocrotonate tautomerase [Halanaerobium congolense]